MSSSTLSRPNPALRAPDGQPDGERPRSRPGSGPAGRDLRLDALRGVFIISMAGGHLGSGQLPDVLTHPFLWVDGAAGFVLLSGLVLGMAMHGRLRRQGPQGPRRWLLRRAGTIYAAHLCLALTAISVRSTTGEPGFLPSWDELGGVGPGLVDLLALRIQTTFANVLPFYVFCLLVAIAAVELLRRSRGGTVAVLGVSLIVYAAAQMDPRVLLLADVYLAPETWSWGAWQVLFFGALVLGWHWRDGVRPWLAAHRRPVLWTAVAVTLGCTALARALSPWQPGAGSSSWIYREGFEKYQLRPGVALFLAATGITTYAVLGLLQRPRASRPLVRFLARIGSQSLDCFLLLSATELAMWLAYPTGRPWQVDTALFGVVLVAFWFLATARNGLLRRAPETPGSAEQPTAGQSR